MLSTPANFSQNDASKEKLMSDASANNPIFPPQSTSSGWQSNVPSGWKFSLTTGAITSLVVFLINLIVTIYSLTIPQSGGHGNGRRILFEGSCSKSRTLNTWLHVLINIFSSVLLAASNYSMQCLSAPTRADVDRAHARGEWLDIGIPSVRNLFKIPPRRTVLWWLLIFSSVPLHLFYNSVVFSSLSIHNYPIYSVEDGSNGTSIFDRSFDSINDTTIFEQLNLKWPEKNLEDGLTEEIEGMWNDVKSGQFRNLTALQCIDEFATAFQTSWNQLLLVTEPKPDSNATGIPFRSSWASYSLNGVGGCPPDVYEWICPQKPCSTTCRSLLSQVRKNVDTWSPINPDNRVKYCLSKPADQLCRLHFSTTLIGFVIAANAFKAIILAYTAFYPPEEPLLVLGDAIESFLTSPDVSSARSCLVSAKDIKDKPKGAWTGPRKWSFSKKRWSTAVSGRRWASSFILYSIAFTVSVVLFGWGITALMGPHDFASWWNLGFGKVSETALIVGLDTSSAATTLDTQTIRSVLLSNFPQLCFSVLYFQYNGLFTGMLAAKEWGDFGLKRRALRVSANPRGEQRSRYFLQLPYRWSIPLLLMSILIHWMLSQSIFVVSVEAFQDKYYYGDRDSNGNYFDYFNDYSASITCGYSPVAIFSVILTSLVMFGAVIITGFLRLPTGIPVVGSCSLAIAAACHQTDGSPQPEAPLIPLRWGVMKRHDERQGEYGVGHCGFSGEYVEAPEVGVRYA
ncbi:Fc.00g032700.m01.CDS01 [Cosmosporella sp. VM-42]